MNPFRNGDVVEVSSGNPLFKNMVVKEVRGGYCECEYPTDSGPQRGTFPQGDLQKVAGLDPKKVETTPSK